jgi:NTE family protein
MKMPLYVAASELTQGKIEYFSEGALFDALMASASVPFIFPPVILDGKFYVDGVPIICP